MTRPGIRFLWLLCSAGTPIHHLASGNPAHLSGTLKQRGCQTCAWSHSPCVIRQGHSRSHAPGWVAMRAQPLCNYLPTPSSRSLQTTVLLEVPSQWLVSWGKPMMSEDAGGGGGVCACLGPQTWLCGVSDMPFQFLKSSKIFQATCS